MQKPDSKNGAIIQAKLMNKPQKDIYAQSYLDIADDFSELMYLYESGLQKLRIVESQMQRRKKEIEKEVLKESLQSLHFLEKKYEKGERECRRLQESIKKESRKELSVYIAKKDFYYQLLRVYQSEIGGIITATDWQSPTFLHSLSPLAGRQSGDIKGTVNDYKRDQHLDGKEYEDAFLREYIEGVLKFTVHIYTVSSGMAALQTILTHLASENKPIARKVLMGKGTYFENKDLVEGFSHHVLEEDEMNTKVFCEAIRKFKPSIIMLDVLGNTPEVTYPDLVAILTYVRNTVKYPIDIVIDNTCLPIFSQPLRFGKGKSSMRIFVFESLNKYHQFGLDRVTGGVIYACGKNVGKLFYAREHAGTNISDLSVHALPKPSKYYLTKRIERFERNAAFLTEAIEESLRNLIHSPIERIAYPVLVSHRAHPVAAGSRFHGSYFSFVFKKKYQTVSGYQRFIKLILHEAKKRNIQIVSGTSFGMNTSRVYLTALRSGREKPFIRFSVGTETMNEMISIHEVVVAALHSYASKKLRLPL